MGSSSSVGVVWAGIECLLVQVLWMAVWVASEKSAARELRRALIRESADAFGIVLAAAQFTLEIALTGQLFAQSAGGRRVNRLFGAGQAQGRARGQFACHPVHLG